VDERWFRGDLEVPDHAVALQKKKKDTES
jgi:hypothetical protein